jgi:signal transduction histidine kinase
VYNTYIRISDEGGGVGKENLARVFDFGFSTVQV